MLGWIGLYAAWQVLDFLFDPVFTNAVNLIYPGATYGWAAPARISEPRN